MRRLLTAYFLSVTMMAFVCPALLQAGITLRNEKGSNLTPAEADANFRYLHGARVAKTISAGAIVVEGTGLYVVDTEASASTDDLVTITGTTDGDLISVWAANASRAVVVKHGGLQLSNGTDFTLNSIHDVIVLRNRGGTLVEEGRTSTAGTELAGDHALLPVTEADLSFNPATQAELDAHINDTTAAHAASAISVTPTGTIAGDDVQEALAELDTEKAATGDARFPTVDEKAGLAANSPTVANPVITQAELDAHQPPHAATHYPAGTDDLSSIYATKAYADAIAGGQIPKASVRAATTINVTLSGTQTVNTVDLINGDRVLVKDQTVEEDNGIYLVGTPWTRSTDADEDSEVTSGMSTFVEEGTDANQGTWVLITTNPITLGTTALTFTKASGSGGGGGGTSAGIGVATDANELVTSTTDETTAYTFSITAGSLVAGMGLRLEAVWDVITQGSEPASTYRAYFGGTEVLEFTRNDDTDLRLNMLLIVNNTNSQTIVAWAETLAGVAVSASTIIETTHNLGSTQTVTLTLDPGATTDSATLRPVNVAQLPTGGGGGSETSGAPLEAEYLLKMAHAALPNAQAIGDLATGLLIGTTGSGELSTHAGQTCTNQVMTAMTASGVFSCNLVTSAMITNGTVSNTDISGSADIAKTKIATAGIWPLSAIPAVSSTLVPGGTDALDSVYATIAYADAIAAGGFDKDPVHAATTAALPANTYSNGASGVGATLTGTSNGALAAQDTVTLTVNQDLLVKDQASALQNGIYRLTTVGTGGTPYILTRRTDADTSPTEVKSGIRTFVVGGSANINKQFSLTTVGTITMGTTGLTFSQTGGPGETITAGDGLTKTGSTLDVGSSSTITVGANDVSVTTGSIGAAQVTDESLTSTDILDGSLTTADLSASAALTKGQISDTGTWEVAEIPSLPTSIITSGTFAAARIGSAAITNVKLGSDAVTTEKVLNGTLLGEDISASAAIAKTKISSVDTWLVSEIPTIPSTKVSTTASGTLSATVLNNALVELDTEKVPTTDPQLTDKRAVHTHASDCTTGVVTARLQELCTDQDDGAMWMCLTPAAAGGATVCDDPQEWLGVGSAVMVGVGVATDANQTVTSTTAATTAYSFSIPADSLSAGMSLRIFASWIGDTQAASPGTVIEMRLNNTTILATTRTTSANLKMHARMTVNNPTSQTTDIWFELEGGGGVEGDTAVATTEDLSALTVITFRVTPGAISDSWTLRNVIISEDPPSGSAYVGLTQVQGNTGTVTVPSASAVKLQGAEGMTCVAAAGDPITVTCTPRQDRQNIRLVDEFLGGRLSTGDIGELNWSLLAGNITHVNGVAGEPGIKNIATGAVINTTAALYLSDATTAGQLIPSDTFDLRFRVRPQTVTTQELRLGLLSSAASAPPTDGIFFGLDTAVDNKWACVTRASSTQTRTATGTTVVANTWYWLRLARTDASTIKFYLNDVEVCSHTTNIPTAAVLAALQLENLEAVDKHADLGYFEMRMTGLTR